MMAKSRKSSKSDNVHERIAKSKARMLAALEKKLGIVTDAAKSARISRDTHYRWLREDPEYKKRVVELEEVALDFVEGNLFENIRGGDSSLIKFYLTTKGRHRGYILKQDHNLLVNPGPSVDEIEWRITAKKAADEQGSSN